MKKWYLTIMALFCAVILPAVDITESDGTYYPNAEIIKKTPLGIQFICKGKAGWLDYRDLPEAEAVALGYDKAKAEAFEQQLADNDGNTLPSGAMPPDNDPQLQQMLQNPNNVPPSPDNTTNINPGDQISYNPTVVNVGAPVTSWVYWNNRYYPAPYWHHWYWNYHWCYHNGHYYPAHYWYHHGTWYHGHYYPYHHGYLAKHPEHQPEYRPYRCGGGERQWNQRGGGAYRGGGGGYHGGGRR